MRHTWKSQIFYVRLPQFFTRLLCDWRAFVISIARVKKRVIGVKGYKRWKR